VISLIIAASAYAGITAYNPYTQTQAGLDCSAGFVGLLDQVFYESGTEKAPAAVAGKYGALHARAEHALYTYTRPSDPAYPAVVRQRIREGEGGMVIDMGGCGWGDQQAFARMMREFTNKNVQLRKDIEARRKTIPAR
jgi:hypothetical protein